jgi:NitT/TauT family transport system substrate-binding protein
MKRNSIILAVVAVVAVLVVAAVLLSGALAPSSSKAIRYTEVAPAQQQDFIKSGQIDGGVSWEPYVSDSVEAGTGNVLVWSGDIWPDHPCCVVAVDAAYAAANPDVVAKVLKAHIEASMWIADTIANKDTPGGQANYTLLLNIGAQFSDRSTEVVDAAMQHLKIVYNITTESVAYFKMFTQEYINASLIQSGKIADIDSFLNGFIDLQYLDAAKDVQPVAAGSALTTVSIGYLQGDLHQFARVVAENTTVGGGRSLFNTYGIQTTTPNGMPGSGYSGGQAVMTAFAASDVNIQFGYLGSPPAILNKANQNVDIKIIAMANTEGSALVVKNSIDSTSDLGGLKIGIPNISSIQYLLLLAIAEKYGYDVVKA